MNPPNRIRELRRAKDMTLERLAQLAGTSNQQISKLEIGRGRLTVDWMERIAAALGCEPADLLLSRASTLEASQRLKAPPIPRPAEKKSSAYLVEFDGQEIVFIPVFDLRLSAGPGAWVDEEREPLYFEPLRYQWLRSITDAPLEMLTLAKVAGDSMWETLHDGDVVLIDRRKNRPTKEGIYGLRWEDDLLIKRISVDPRNGLLTVSSDNPRYETYRKVKVDDLSVIGRVIWIGRRI